MKRIQSTAIQVNMIRRARLMSLRGKGEVELTAETVGAVARSKHGDRATGVCVVDGSRLERGSGCEDGRTTWDRPEFMAQMKRPKSRRVEVRAPIGVEKQGNACGAKGGRKANGAVA